VREAVQARSKDALVLEGLQQIALVGLAQWFQRARVFVGHQPLVSGRAMIAPRPERGDKR
jgi:hypothetical protein